VSLVECFEIKQTVGLIIRVFIVCSSDCLLITYAQYSFAIVLKMSKQLRSRRIPVYEDYSKLAKKRKVEFVPFS
jgi:predicted HTH domain antitoxin